ncbi:MAG TPA: nitrate reductase molybdenum cofactor assembly chaperone [Candidatus Competibacteraceae bacterium]|nr:nitrate reductase molybdenum cofactor assembly chaperone [Candidatus Competibacteraceae bacterium]
MQILKALSALLTYPQQPLIDALPELVEVVDGDPVLPRETRLSVLELIAELESTDLFELQEHYVALFDRGRQLSLHLFEHVHGESRARGQAMVELMEIYRRHGFQLDARELPDYVPLFLEFLGNAWNAETRQLLSDAMPVLSLLGARLAERSSSYSAIFDALEAIGGSPAERDAIRDQARTEGPDETVVNMDKIWEEEAVTFMGNPSTCGVQTSGNGNAQPVQWVKNRTTRDPGNNR